MTQPVPELYRRNDGQVARRVIFFALYLLYLQFVVDLRLIYHGGGMVMNFPAFFRGWAFFQQFLAYPGGIIEYISAFLSQLFSIPWAGPLVVTSQAWLFCIFTESILKAATSRRIAFAGFVPAVLLLVIYGQYAYHFSSTMALLAAIVFVPLQMRIAAGSASRGAIIFVLLSAIIYYLTGAAYLLFAAVCVIDEMLLRRRAIPATIYVAAALVIPYGLGVLLFGVSIIDAYSFLLPLYWKTLAHSVASRMVSVACILYLFVPLLLSAIGIRRLLPRFSLRLPAKTLVEWFRARPAAAAVGESFILVAVTAAAALFSFNRERKAIIAVDYYAQLGDWRAVLAAGAGNPRHPYVIHAVNRALYQTGRLTEDMFCYPQQPHAMFLTDDTSWPAYWRLCDTYLDLGLVNVAEYDLVQCLEIYGRQPAILKRLALINLAKGNAGAARVCLHALQKTLFDCNWAAAYLHKVSIDPNLDSDPDVVSLRRLMPQHDREFTSFDPNMLTDLLDTNSRNRMAFEYLMAFYMVTMQLDKFVDNLGRLNDADYPQIPPVYEQAIQVYQTATRKAVEPHARKISYQSRQLFNDFTNIYIRKWAANKRAAFAELAQNFGDTYMFYYTYGLSGIKPASGQQAVHRDLPTTRPPPRFASEPPSPPYVAEPRPVGAELKPNADRPPRIRPDYSDAVIPPNIAPLNLLIEEDGSHYRVKISSRKGKPIEIVSRSPSIVIARQPWRELLSENKGQPLYFDVSVKAEDGRWVQFSTLTATIAAEPIDRYLVYRKMHPTHTQHLGKVSIRQRDLESFDETLILDNDYYKSGCMNCHAFCNGRTDKILMGVRGPRISPSTLFVHDGAVTKIGAKFGYTSWHPSGRLAVYSIDELPMFFHSARNEVRDTIDLNSALAYFLADSKTIKTALPIANKSRLETWPAWSPDGKYLYFCSAPMLWADTTQFPANLYRKVKYDLVRIAYDVETDKWGEVETVIAAADTHLSIGMPKVSPDGRWLLFCMFDYGYFPSWQQSSDLYIVDLDAAQQTGRYEYRALEINSSLAESWHSWSSNSRWIIFTSKRDYGVFARCYISYVDETGKVHKPFVVPQKDPAFYDSCLESHNTPELVTEPLPLAGEQLARVVRNPKSLSVAVPISGATPLVQPSSEYQPANLQRN